MILPHKTAHQNGEIENSNEPLDSGLENTTFSVETFNGKLQIEWDPNVSTTMFGLLPFFIEFLKLGNLFTSRVEECPLEFRSNNAPSKLDYWARYFCQPKQDIIRQFFNFSTRIRDKS